MYRILSLDGGGMRGLITLTVMRRLDEAVPGWLQKVDLITGSSTGGILAIGLAYGSRPEELVSLYTICGRKIFARSRRERWLGLRGILRAGYDNRNLQEELRHRLGNARLSDLLHKVLIPALALDNGHSEELGRRYHPRFFHNFDQSGDIEAYKAALYTSASPGYFPSVDGFIDGAIVAYHPGAAALTWVQAGRVRASAPVSLAETALLSLGTGTVRYYIAGERHDWSIARWFPSMLRLMRDGNVGLVEYQCRLLLGDRYHRVSPVFARPIDTDVWEQCDRLQQIGEDVDIRPVVDWLRAVWEQGDEGRDSS